MKRRSSRGNPNHYPKGSSKGGQFAPKGVGMSVNHTEEYYDIRTSYRNGDIDAEEYDERIAELSELTSEEEQHLFRTQVAFTPAQSIDEAEEYARSLGVRPYYKGLSLDTANICNQCLTETFEQFPELKERIKVIGSGQKINREIKAKLSPLVLQRFQAIYGGTYPQSAIDRAAKKQTNRYVSNMKGYAYCKRVVKKKDDEEARIATQYEGIYINENGIKDLNRDYDFDVKHNYHPETDNPMKSIVDHELGHAIDYQYDIGSKVSTTRTTQEIKDGLSVYGAKNKREYIAEAWSEYRNSEKPRVIAMEVGKLMESAGRKQ